MDLLARSFTYLGALTVIYLVVRLLNFLTPYLSPPNIEKFKHGSSDAWVLITGASDGIGRAVAFEMASKGFNVALHGRNPPKLEAVKEMLQAAYPNREYRCIVCDAGKAEAKDIERLVHEVQDLNLTILINNVGGGDAVAPLEKTAASQVDSTININARFPAHLTRCLMSRFAAAQGPILIMNIGSLAAFICCYASIYGGSKAFDLGFSTSLNIEMAVQGRGHRVDIMALPVGRVTEAAGDTAKPSLFTPTATTTAKAIVARIGCKKAVVVPYFWHAVQITIIGFLPKFITVAILGPIMKERYEQMKKQGKTA